MTPEQIEARRERGRKLAADRKAALAPKEYIKPGHRAADPVMLTRDDGIIPSALAAPDLLKAILALGPQEKAALAAILAPPPPPAVPAGARPALPAGANLYEILPLQEALKEALFELGATDRYKNAVRTALLAEHLHAKGFGRGRAIASTTFDLRDLADGMPKTRQDQQRWPLVGWVHFVGGGQPMAPNNWEWCIAPEALAEAERSGRKVAPAPPHTVPREVVLRRVGDETPAAFPEDLLPGKHSAAEFMPAKKVIAQIDHG